MEPTLAEYPRQKKHYSCETALAEQYQRRAKQELSSALSPNHGWKSHKLYMNHETFRFSGASVFNKIISKQMCQMVGEKFKYFLKMETSAIEFGED